MAAKPAWGTGKEVREDDDEADREDAAVAPNDFTRFTHLGHRRLFRRFEELSSGVVAGPGTVLAWSCNYFLLGFVRSKVAISFIKAFTRLTLFWPKYFDRYLNEKRGAFDGASCYYFLGRKSREVLADRELVKLYEGIL